MAQFPPLARLLQQLTGGESAGFKP